MAVTGLRQGGAPAPQIATDLAHTQMPLHEARHLPSYYYNSTELYRREKTEIFMRDWICVARVEEVDKPGDYMTRRIIDEPVIIARNATGKINAFANVCRHRGAEVATGTGNVKEFSCPYHAWLYDLDGQLIGAPYMKDAANFNPTTCRLPALQCDIWAGWVFVNFDADARPLTDFVARFDQSFGLLQQENCRLGDKFARDVDCNWKFINENLQDVYHFQTLHANTFGEHVTAESFSYDLDERTGGVAAFYPAAPTTFDGQSRFGKMPWMDEYPMSFARMGFMVPTMNIFARVDMAIACVVWPLGPDKTRMEWYSLFPNACHDLPDFADKVKDYHDLLTVVVEEDQDMVASLQRNMGSTHFAPGRMSLYETTVHNMINGYLNRMFA
jgi:phenylpropionate dioxygenase-like ring-hydroxylating dioxygenase large terminal subunit